MKNTFKTPETTLRVAITVLLAVIAVLTASCDMEIPVAGVTLNKTIASLAVGDSEKLIATIEPSDATNQKMTWSSSDTTKVSVSSSGEIKGIAIGSATITVKADDGGFTATCDVTVTGSTPIPVPVTGVTINKPSTSFLIGGTETLTATVLPSTATNQNVTWSSSDSSKVSVSASGVITGVAVGSAVITATTEDGGKTATCSVTVRSTPKEVTRVTLNQTTASTTIGSFITLIATIEPADATSQSVTWSSSETTIAGVISDGTNEARVLGMKAGTATITVTADGGKTAACVVTVSPSSYPVTGLSLNKLSTGILVGATETLIATVAPDNATNKNVNWNSSAPTIATVSSSGVVSGVAEGTAIITATTVDQNKTATCIVTISARALAVTSVSLNKSNTGLLIGGTETLIATVLPLTATNQNVTWKSSDDTIATVANGIVSGVAAGTAIITATTNDQNKTATCTVRVSATTVSVTSVYIRTSTSLAAGNYETLACTINPNTATNQNVTWTSSAPAIATVSETGVVSGVSPGSATITVSTEDGGKTAFCNVTITAVPVTGVTLDNSTLALNVGATGTIAATVLPANATNKAVIWSSSDTTKATVSASGVVTAVAAGSATITVRTADGSRQATCTVTITAIPSLTVDILGNPYVGEVLFANAKSNVAGVIYYEWFRGLDKISSNTSNNYTIRFEDAGKTITVKVTCGTQTVEKSVSVADVDYTVEIANSDNNLFATIRYGYNTYYSINTLGFTCQWYRDDVAISGSTLDHYTPQPADAGKAIKVRVIRYEKTVFSEPFNIPNGSNVTSETLGLYLTILSENTASSPHNITLKVNDNNYNDFDDIKNALNSAYNKYVNLNLSGSTITNFGSLYGCTSLVSITIPASVLEFSESAFDSCNSLTDILVESGNTKYSSDNGILYNIDKTTLIVCPQNKTDPITIPSSVTIIGSFAFEDCILTSITIPNNVKEIEDNAFTRCTKLASVTITDGVTSIGESAFSDCTSLTSVIIPDSVTSIKSNTFSQCTSLANVTIGSGVTSIESYAFYNCTSLSSVTFKSTIDKDKFNKSYAFPGNLRDKFYEDDEDIGTLGTYTTSEPGEDPEWTL